LKWYALKGGVNSDGSVVEKPIDLEFAQLIDGICQRYHQLPSQVLKEDATMIKIIHMVAIIEEKEMQKKNG